MIDQHTAGKFPKAYAQKSNAIMVSWIHIGLDLKNKTGERRSHFHRALITHMSLGLRR